MTKRLCLVALGALLCVHSAHAGWFDSYQSYAAYNAKLDEFATSYPGRASTFTAGTSFEGRAIRGVRITGNGMATVAKKAVVLNGMLHAREWIAGMVPMYVADQLLQSYGVDPRVTNVLDNTEIYVLPVMNPDGYEYSRNVFRNWRKNRRPNGDGSFGVDLNRNFGVGWGLNTGSSPNPSSETYRGTAPFSEPESTALRNFALAHPELVAHIDFHSYGQQILIPWGYQPAPVPDQALLELMSNTMAASIAGVSGRFYEHGDPFLYLSSGTARDWTYGDQGAYPFTIELRPTTSNPGFELPATEIIPTGQELFPAVLNLAEFTIQLAGGDFDLNGARNCGDVDRLVAAIVGGSNKSEFDLTGDGQITSDDLVSWLARAGAQHLGPGLSYLPGDANLDGVVDGSDFSLWNTNKFTNTAAWCRGDFTADGVVDGSDFSVWNVNKFRTSDAFTAVPEPAGTLAVFLGILLRSLLVRKNELRRESRAGL